MPKCFISYSEDYKGVMKVLRNLLEALEFQVDVCDGPDIDRPPIAAVQQRIADSDCMVLILGPRKNETDRNDLEPAHWPAEEGVWAVAKEKPVALVLHPGTRVPESIRFLQTPARFNFWDTSDLVENFHKVVKHLLDLKRRIDLPPGDQPHIYTQAIVRNRIQRGGTLVLDVYHEVVARQECERFHHCIDTGLDQRPSAHVALAGDDAYEIEATLNPGRHAVSLEFLARTERELPYYVVVDPPLLPGERLGYRREFTLKNAWPLSKADLLAMSNEEGFPDLYRVEGQVYYGDVWEVVNEMDLISLSINFPRKIPIVSRRALAIPHFSKKVNPIETERCNSQECLNLDDSPSSGDRVLSLMVRRPLINHKYVLLYQPG